MKKLVYTITTVFTVFILLSLKTYIQNRECVIKNLQKEKFILTKKYKDSLDTYKYNYNIVLKQYVKLYIKLDSVKDLQKFLTLLGERESNNNYACVNKYGYMGRFQFGLNTIKYITKKSITKEEFLTNPKLQDSIMLSYMLHNKKILERNLNLNEILNDSITISSLLAASHLGGAGSVIKYFRYGKISKDAFGTSIKEYMKFNQF